MNNQFANMLLGNYTQASETKGIFYGQFREKSLEAFGQDSWKISRRLSSSMNCVGRLRAPPIRTDHSCRTTLFRAIMTAVTRPDQYRDWRDQRNDYLRVGRPL